jgi:phosphohistidine phosphatase SixA
MDLPATVVLIRHADTDGDPASTTALNATGLARAQALRRILAEAGIGAIFVTATRRSRETAASLADDLGLTPTIFGEDDLVAAVPDIADAIRALPSSSVALVVCHSYTLPQIIAGLDGPPISAIGAAEFDHLFVQVGPRLTHLRYGA